MASKRNKQIEHYVCVLCVLVKLLSSTTPWSAAGASDWPSRWPRTASTVPATAQSRANWRWTSSSCWETASTRPGRPVSYHIWKAKKIKEISESIVYQWPFGFGLSLSLLCYWCFFWFPTVCQIMSKGVVAVLGPSASPASNSIISNICGEKEASVFCWVCLATCLDSV